MDQINFTFDSTEDKRYSSTKLKKMSANHFGRKKYIITLYACFLSRSR